MENDEHYAYRTMYTLHAVRAAVAGAFVRGGLGDLALGACGVQFSGAIWRGVDAVMWILAIAMYAITALWMTRSYSSRVPQWIARAV